MKAANVFTTLTAAAIIGTGSAIAQSTTTAETATVPTADVAAETQADCGYLTCLLADVRFGNPFDADTWWDGAGDMDHHSASMKIVPTDPAFLFSIPNPEMHTQIHMSLTNPENWGQFMKPEMMTNMMATENFENLLDLDTYKALFDPQTFAYWAQPGAYKHLIEVEHYAQLINPTAYTNLMQDVFSAWFGGLTDEG